MHEPISIVDVALPMADRITGALRKKRSLLTQNWSKPAASAACARATYSGRVRSLLTRMLKRIAGADHRFGFDFDEVLIADQVCLHHDVGGAYASKACAVHTGDGVPV